jgi:hypothetical protein
MLTSKALIDSIKADHGYNLDSKSVQNLLHVMCNLTLQERRDFLQFVTGSPKLPIGGLFLSPARERVLIACRLQGAHAHVHCCLQAE